MSHFSLLYSAEKKSVLKGLKQINGRQHILFFFLLLVAEISNVTATLFHRRLVEIPAVNVIKPSKWQKDYFPKMSFIYTFLSRLIFHIYHVICTPHSRKRLKFFVLNVHFLYPCKTNAVLSNSSDLYLQF